MSKKGYYLPELATRAIHGEYLWKVFTEQVYCPLRKDIKIGFCIEKVSKIDLVEYLEEEVKPKTMGLKEDY